MKSTACILSILFLGMLYSFNQRATKESIIQKKTLNEKICGMSLTAPPNQWINDPMAEMKAININWVALLPYRIFDASNAHINFDTGNWWGETVEGISESIRLAKLKGIKTMIKPQLWSRDMWIGNMNYASQAQWNSFHQDYTKFICHWAHIADSLDADMLCIGTEIKYSSKEHPAYWNALADTVRQIYSGPITYASNWDEYQHITFWDKLDYIGVDAYFPLINKKTPTVSKLKEAWKPIVETLKATSKQWNKPILFTEFGYLSLDGCAHNTWELEKDRASANVNELAQSNAVQALLETFGEKDWWAGGFQWKWYADIHLSTRDYSNDYSPQNKTCETLLKEIYK